MAKAMTVICDVWQSTNLELTVWSFSCQQELATASKGPLLDDQFLHQTKIFAKTCGFGVHAVLSGCARERTVVILKPGHANYGTHRGQWDRSHSLQATSKGLHPNLHANLLTRPVWMGLTCVGGEWDSPQQLVEWGPMLTMMTTIMMPTSLLQFSAHLAKKPHEFQHHQCNSLAVSEALNCRDWLLDKIQNTTSSPRHWSLQRHRTHMDKSCHWFESRGVWSGQNDWFENRSPSNQVEWKVCCIFGRAAESKVA